MQRLLAVLLVLIGLTGLVLGRLGETTWAPAEEITSMVDLSDAGPAVVIEPGVLYVGGEEGEVVIEGASDITVITAANSDIDAYLEDVHHTRVTGASDWTTLSTEDVNPDGADELTDPASSDLWRTVDTSPSPYRIDISEFWAEENGADEQVYRSLLIVTDGTQPGAEKISITWPNDAENGWVPFAYAGGAALAVIGLVLLVVTLGARRREEEDASQMEEDEQIPASALAAGTVGGAPILHDGAGGVDRALDTESAQSSDHGTTGHSGTSGTSETSEAAVNAESAEVPASADDQRGGSDLDRLFDGADQAPREENVWKLGTEDDDEEGRR